MKIRDSTRIYFFYQPKSYRFKFPLLGYVSSPHSIIREGAGWREGKKKKRYTQSLYVDVEL
jgi:hypothetical protein